MRETAVNASDLQHYLDSHDDFALEMQVRRQVAAHGLEYAHGGSFEDPLTRSIRRYDLRACWERADCRVDLAIECRHLRPHYPLLVSRIPRRHSESYHQLVCSINLEPGPFSPLSVSPCEVFSLTPVSGGSIYLPDAPVGKAFTQAGIRHDGQPVGGDAGVRDKWSTAIGSLAELAGNAAWYRDKTDGLHFLTSLIPLLVVPDATLWAVDYDADGRQLGPAQPLDEVEAFVGKDFWKVGGNNYSVSHLHLCTVSGLEQFLTRLTSDDAFWQRLFPLSEIESRLGLHADVKGSAQGGGSFFEVE